MSTKNIQDSLTKYDVIDLVLKLGADRYEERKDCIVFPTICHNDNSAEASMKLYYYYNNHVFHCYTECDESFNIFELFEKRFKTCRIKYDFLEDIYIPIINKIPFNIPDEFEAKLYEAKKARYDKRNIPILKPYSENVLSIFSTYYPVEWINEGISIESMRKYNILYWENQNKAIIPHYDIQGNLVGIRGRAFNEWEIETCGKYRPVKVDGELYSHPLSLNLYGLNISLPFIQKRKTAIIFEGEKSCLKYDTYFSENLSVAICGSSLNKLQINLLIQHAQPQEIVIALDKEYVKSASKEGEEYFNKKVEICKKYNKYCEFSFLYDRENLLSLKDAPIDKGKEVFLELYKKRVKVK